MTVITFSLSMMYLMYYSPKTTADFPDTDRGHDYGTDLVTRTDLGTARKKTGTFIHKE